MLQRQSAEINIEMKAKNVGIEMIYHISLHKMSQSSPVKGRFAIAMNFL